MQNLEILSRVTLDHYLILSALVFATGMVGVLLRKNIIVMLMGIELMLNAINLSFVALSKYTGNVNGLVMVFFVMVIAAAEAGVGLAIAVAVFKKFKEIDIRFFENLKG